MASQKLRIVELQLANPSLTNQVSEYKKAVGSLEAKLKTAYAGIKKQNASLRTLIARRDVLAKKYNDSVNDRNHIVAQYSQLVSQVK